MHLCRSSTNMLYQNGARVQYNVSVLKYEITLCEMKYNLWYKLIMRQMISNIIRQGHARFVAPSLFHSNFSSLLPSPRNTPWCKSKYWYSRFCGMANQTKLTEWFGTIFVCIMTWYDFLRSRWTIWRQPKFDLISLVVKVTCDLGHNDPIWFLDGYSSCVEYCNIVCEILCVDNMTILLPWPEMARDGEKFI